MNWSIDFLRGGARVLTRDLSVESEVISQKRFQGRVKASLHFSNLEASSSSSYSSIIFVTFQAAVFRTTFCVKEALKKQDRNELETRISKRSFQGSTVANSFFELAKSLQVQGQSELARCSFPLSIH